MKGGIRFNKFTKITCFCPCSLSKSLFNSKMFGTLIPNAVASAKNVSTVKLDDDMSARLPISSSYAKFTTAYLLQNQT